MEKAMELTREIYWNVGHGAMTLVPMYLLTIVAIVVAVKAAMARIEVYKQGLPLNRTDNLGDRIKDMLAQILLQTKVIRVTIPGIFHGLFFWAFFILFIGTCLIVLQADFTDLLFDVKFLKGTFYLLFSLVLDLAGLVAIVMLAALFVRRYVIKPEGLETSRDHAVMHGLLMIILLTGFVIEGARMSVTEMGTELAPWSPVGYLFAKGFGAMGEGAARTIHKLSWWFHLLLVMGFIVLIPYTKLRHIVTTSANYLFTDRGPKGKPTSLDLEDEDAEAFGATTVKELTWKDIFDADACTLCKRCQDR